MDPEKELELVKEQNRLIEKMYKRDITALQEELGQVKSELDKVSRKYDDLKKQVADAKAQGKQDIEKLRRYLRHV